jgi:hypothetical protein
MEQPESINPYQFAYGNPFVYSDPSGNITINELNVAQVIDDILENIYRNFQGNLSKKVIDQAKGVVTDIFSDAIKKLAPYNPLGQILVAGNGGDLFEAKFKESYCGITQSLGSLGSLVYNSTYYEPAVRKNGEPVTDGYMCRDLGTPNAKRQRPLGTVNPDFIIKGATPPTVKRIPPAFLTGDIKLSSISTSGKQWNAIMNHSRAVWQRGQQFLPLSNPFASNPGYQFVPISLYVTLYSHPSHQKAEMKAIKDFGVFLKVISFFDR